MKKLFVKEAVIKRYFSGAGLFYEADEGGNLTPKAGK